MTQDKAIRMIQGEIGRLAVMVADRCAPDSMKSEMSPETVMVFHNIESPDLYPEIYPDFDVKVDIAADVRVTGDGYDEPEETRVTNIRAHVVDADFYYYNDLSGDELHLQAPDLTDVLPELSEAVCAELDSRFG